MNKESDMSSLYTSEAHVEAEALGTQILIKIQTLNELKVVQYGSS